MMEIVNIHVTKSIKSEGIVSINVGRKAYIVVITEQSCDRLRFEADFRPYLN